MVAAVDAQIMVGRAQLEIAEEHVRHASVVVLPGVDQHLVDAGRGGDTSRHRGRFDELRSRADDREDFHAPAACNVRDRGCNVFIRSTICWT
jgi:hypothetical protein